ncbi:AarF/ABC1/UbiB kinase family protein [Jannaschia sp. LMIT008]|uniref:ABC1 kinase family protein n=1 Tax=Jannaschia maritima TaxID=3032585 RepID=UPI0028111CC9|nr:AarF/ABC1/UbiB kinase family protein [Jannaschia sp. LMIT008]
MDDSTNQGRALPVPAGRLNRIGRLGGLGAGVAGRAALGGLAELSRGRKPVLRDLLLTPGNVRRVTDQLAQMRGAAMKLGQLVSMDTGDVLPPELAGIMARLRDDAHTMPPAQLKQVLGREWPQGWLGRFRSFDVNPIAAASIGQVHRAVLRDGRELAVKVQYPGVAGSIDSDVANVGALIRMSGLLPKGFDLKPYLAEAAAQLHEETDYVREGRWLGWWHDRMAGDGRFAVPAPVPEWTTPHVLAMDYVASKPIEAAADAPQEVRDRIVTDLIELTLQELFAFGVMQTDPNFANYRWQPDTGRIVLLDFGATREIPAAVADLHRRMLRAGLDGDADGLRDTTRAMGFVTSDTDPDHAERIDAMVATMFDDLRRGGPFDMAATDLPERMRDQGIALAEAGYVPPPLPVDILHLQRKFGGIFLLGARLRARVPAAAMLGRFV